MIFHRFSLQICNFADSIRRTTSLEYTWMHIDCNYVDKGVYKTMRSTHKSSMFSLTMNV